MRHLKNFVKPKEVKFRSKMSHWPKIPHRYAFWIEISATCYIFWNCKFRISIHNFFSTNHIVFWFIKVTNSLNRYTGLEKLLLIGQYIIVIPELVLDSLVLGKIWILKKKYTYICCFEKIPLRNFTFLVTQPSHIQASTLISDFPDRIVFWEFSLWMQGHQNVQKS